MCSNISTETTRSNCVPAGNASNDLVHQVDMFPTLLGFAGCEVPQDREIDGIDQGSFFLGRRETSNREGCLVWVGERLHGVKWRHFKVLFVKQRYLYDDVPPAGSPHIVNLIADPKEREPVNAQHLHTWVMGPVGQLLREFRESIEREPLIPAGAPVEFVPGKGARPARYSPPAR